MVSEGSRLVLEGRVGGNSLPFHRLQNVLAPCCPQRGGEAGPGEGTGGGSFAAQSRGFSLAAAVRQDGRLHLLLAPACVPLWLVGLGSSPSSCPIPKG